MDEIRCRLKSLDPTISELIRISGTAGLSLGVLHEGQLCHTANFGYRDVDAQLPPDSDTVFWAGSISKSMIAAAVGLLVEGGKLDFNDIVSHVLPNFEHQDESVQQNATLTHLLAHTSGLGGKGGLWQRDHARIMIDRGESFFKDNGIPSYRTRIGQYLESK